MVGREGFEPSTNWLKANCSTTELTTHQKMEARIIAEFFSLASFCGEKFRGII